MPDRPKPGRDNGRSARSNPAGRFEPAAYEAYDDGWTENAEPAAQDTVVTFERPRSIINYIESPYVAFDRSINMYRGCEHGCIYCFARPSHAYYGLSSGLDFETRLFAKPNAASVLEKELFSKAYKPRHIAIGTNTDPYQPIERHLRLTREILLVLKRFNHPVSLLTKSALIARDIDILTPMAEAGIVRAMLSITTLDPVLARRMEPRASTPKRRLDAVRQLKEAGVPVGVMTAPVIPGLNDPEIECLLEAARDAGADFVGYTILRLPLEVSELFKEWLANAFPERAGKVMRHIRDLNGGLDYDARLSRARRGESDAGGVRPRSAMAQLIEQRFARACRRLGLKRALPPLDPALFRRPVEKNGQLSLFDDQMAG